MRSGEFNHRLETKVLLIVLILISVSLHANLVYYSIGDQNVGITPIPSEWVGTGDESSGGANKEFTIKFVPTFYIAQWEDTFVQPKIYGGPAGWYYPTSPANPTFYLQDELPSFLEFAFNYKIDGFTLFMAVPVEQEYRARLIKLDTMNNFVTDTYFDINFPEYAYLYYATPKVYASIGRNPIKWGNAKYPVTISPTTSLDNLTLSIKFPNTIFTFHAITSNVELCNAELQIQQNFADNQSDARGPYNLPAKNIFAHRLDFYGNIFAADYRIGVGELNLVGGRFPDILDLSPALIYHNTFGTGYSNVIGSADFDLTYGGTKLYGEFALDDFEAPSTEGGSNYKPTAYGYNLGISQSFGADFNIWAERSFTSQWMYTTNYLPYLRFNIRKFKINNYPGARYLMDYPLGFAYGPDATITALGMQGQIGEIDLQYSLEYDYLVKGQVNDGGVVRWRWFWDGWTNNVSSTNGSTPTSAEKTEDAIYHILYAEIDWKNIEVFSKIVNFEQYAVGASLRYEF